MASGAPPDIERLSNSQLVLLTLFVSFVTSIATGIVTVVLLEQAPLEVTQTINRVVERTIERVVTAPSDTKVREVITNPEDLIVKAVSSASPSLVRIVRTQGLDPVASSTAVTARLYRGAGFVVAPEGFIVASSRTTEAEEGQTFAYAAVFKDGTLLPLTQVKTFSTEGVTVFQPAVKNSLKNGIGLARSASSLSLGRTVIVPALGPDTDSIGLGVVSAVSGGSASSTPRLETSISGNAVIVGAPIIDTAGVLVGMQTSERGSLHETMLAGLISKAKDAIDLKEKNQ